MIAAPALDLPAVRRQFPALELLVGGEPVVYLDNPAGTQVPRAVIDAVARYWKEMNANHGGLFPTSERSDAMVAEARRAMATFLNAESPEQIVFGPNMTTLTFALSRAIGRELHAGDEILVTRLEHDANVAPWLALEERGVRVRYADIDDRDCTLFVDDLAAQLGPRTRLVAITHASNAVGTIPDLRAVSRLVHQAGAWLWVDAVHYAPHGPIDVQAIGCDALVCSAYKFYGPHLGILYGRREFLERLRPYKVRPAADTIPDRFETGTQNHEGLSGLLGALGYLAALGGGVAPERSTFVQAMARIQAHEGRLVARLLAGLRGIPGLRVYGIVDEARLGERAPTVSLTWPPYRPEALARWLGRHKVFTWHGDHYARVLMERLGLQDGGSLRIGIAHYNTEAEVDQALEILAAFSGDP